MPPGLDGATEGWRNRQRSSEGYSEGAKWTEWDWATPLTPSPTVLQAPTFGGRGHRPSGQRSPASSAGSATTYGSKTRKS